jgi:hypothetical protein
MNSRTLFRFAVAASVVALSGAAQAADPARVIALQGEASTEAGRLAVGSTIADGSTIRTGADGRVGILASQIYVQLDPDSVLRIEGGAADPVRMALVEGRARVVDTRTDPVPADLAVINTNAAIAGGDSEYYILKEKGGRYAMFCEWTGKLAVTRQPQSVTAGSNECVLSKPHEPLYGTNGHDHQIPLLAMPVAAFNDPASDHFNTADVAGGPPGLFADPLFAPDFARDPCDVPGSGCGQLRGPIVVEPPPDTGGCAPGVACE